MTSNITFKSPISMLLASFQTSAQYILHCSGFVHLVVPQMLLKLANSYDFVCPYPSPGSGLMPLFSEYNYWSLNVSVAYTFFFTNCLWLLASPTVSMFAIWVKFLPPPTYTITAPFYAFIKTELHVCNSTYRPIELLSCLHSPSLYSMPSTLL